jgi:hypothetical protein
MWIANPITSATSARVAPRSRAALALEATQPSQRAAIEIASAISSLLELSEAKTRIVHMDDGFDFLGFNLRRFPNGKLLARPRRRRSRCTAGSSPPSYGPTGRCRRPR